MAEAGLSHRCREILLGFARRERSELWAGPHRSAGEEVGYRGFIGPKKGNPASSHYLGIVSAFGDLNLLLVDREPVAIAEVFAAIHESRQTDRARTGPQGRSSA